MPEPRHPYIPQYLLLHIDQDSWTTLGFSYFFPGLRVLDRDPPPPPAAVEPHAENHLVDVGRADADDVHRRHQAECAADDDVATDQLVLHCHEHHDVAYLTRVPHEEEGGGGGGDEGEEEGEDVEDDPTCSFI